MKLRLRIGGRVVTATLNDTEAARDFASLLPLTVTTSDLLGRETVAHLPRAISTSADHSNTYEVGDIGYWAAGPDVAFYYHQDGQRIPDPGIVLLGKIDSGVDAFDGATSVRIEPAGAS
jgi:hypothetical protein